MFSEWWTVAIGLVAGLVLVWLALGVVLWLSKPDDSVCASWFGCCPTCWVAQAAGRGIRDAERCARSSGVVVGLSGMAIDLIPDFIPVLGYADDAIIVALVVRSVARRAGPAALSRHWPGTAAGLLAVRKLCGILTSG